VAASFGAVSCGPNRTFIPVETRTLVSLRPRHRSRLAANLRVIACHLFAVLFPTCAATGLAPAPSRPILPRPILPCSILPRPILPRPILLRTISCPVPSCPVPSCPVPSCPVPSCPDPSCPVQRPLPWPSECDIPCFHYSYCLTGFRSSWHSKANVILLEQLTDGQGREPYETVSVFHSCLVEQQIHVFSQRKLTLVLGSPTYLF